MSSSVSVISHYKEKETKKFELSVHDLYEALLSKKFCWNECFNTKTNEYVKLHFDYDEEIESGETAYQQANEKFNKIVEYLSDTFGDTEYVYVIGNRPKDTGKFKISYHIIYQNKIKMSTLKDLVKTIINPRMHRDIGLVFDDKIYRNGWNKFRLPYCRKDNTDDSQHYLHPCGLNEDNFEKFLIQLTDGLPTFDFTKNQTETEQEETAYFTPEVIKLADAPLAKCFYNLFKDEFIYESDKQEWFYWDTKYWSLDKDSGHFIKCIEILYNKILTHILQDGIETSKYFTNNKDKKQFFTKLSNLQNLNKIVSIQKIARCLFSKTFAWNTIPELITFSNGVYDFRTMKFRNSTRDEYINNTLSTGYDYLEENKEDDEYLVNQYLSLMFTNIEEREVIYRVLGSGLLGKNIKKFVLFNNASGNNGKSKFLEFVGAMLGNYYYCGAKKILVEDKMGGNPEKANMSMKRLIHFEEPNEDTSLLSDVIKELTGNDKLNSRKNFSNDTEMHNHGTYILCCNNKPRIDCQDSAVASRMIDIPFRSTFIKNVENNFETLTFTANSYFEEKTFREKYRLSFFHILKHYANTLINSSYDIPLTPELKNRTSVYMNDSNLFLSFLNEYYSESTTYIKIDELLKDFNNTSEFRIIDKNEKKRYGKKKIIAQLIIDPIYKSLFKKEHYYKKDSEEKISKIRNVLFVQRLDDN